MVAVYRSDDTDLSQRPITRQPTLAGCYLNAAITLERKKIYRKNVLRPNIS
jgi:hypothetical protein